MAFFNWNALLHFLRLRGDWVDRPDPEPEDEVLDNVPTLVEESKPSEPIAPEVPGVTPRRPPLTRGDDGEEPWQSSVVLDDGFYESIVDNRDVSPKGHRKKMRNLDAINTVVLHQTGVERQDETAVSKSRNVICHVFISPGGTVCINHPWEAYLYAADLFNSFSVSIEFSGNFEGHPGEGDWYKPNRFGRGVPTPLQLHRGKQVLKWLIYEENLNITTIVAHRQARTGKKAAKVLDPGWQVYSNVAMWAQDELRLDRRPDWTLGNGATIPDSWEHPENYLNVA